MIYDDDYDDLADFDHGDPTAPIANTRLLASLAASARAAKRRKLAALLPKDTKR